MVFKGPFTGALCKAFTEGTYSSSSFLRRSGLALRTWPAHFVRLSVALHTRSPLPMSPTIIINLLIIIIFDNAWFAGYYLSLIIFNFVKNNYFFFLVLEPPWRDQKFMP